MIELLVSVLVGLPIGIVASLAAWWVLYHGLSPVVRFSESISKEPVSPADYDRTGNAYYVKLENAGTRPIIDVEIRAQLRLRGLGRDPDTSWRIEDLPLSLGGAPTVRVARLRPARWGEARRVVRLYVNDVEAFRGRPLYPQDIRQKSNQRLLLLEDILTMGKDATLHLSLFGYDEFSGSRKLFMSKEYSVGDIRQGTFTLGALTVEPLITQQCS